MRDTRALRRIMTIAVAASVAVSVMVAGYATAEPRGPWLGVSQLKVPQQAPAPLLHSSIPTGSEAVTIAQPLVITAAAGTLSTVTVTDADGQPLGGTLSADRTRWISQPLAYDTRYTATATGTGVGGRPAAPLTSTFHTVKPASLLEVDAFRPSQGQVVGVAMPISIYFNQPVTDKAAVERQLTVTPSVPTEGSFHWVGDNQVNWRPKEFWTAGTTVTVSSTLRGVDAGSETFGAEDDVLRFTIGHSHEAVGDTAKHVLMLYSDGQLVRTMPASFGSPRYPTEAGMHVAFEKHLTERMRSDSWGGPKRGEPGFYDEVLPLAVRISANGEYIHVNGATVAQQGRVNVSHGCVNLSPANGRLFYDWVQVGDPVDIVNSTRPLTTGEGDISDWLIPWSDYRAGSALPLPPLLGLAPQYH